jgi:diguanylate cyclase (GGDEF)-like protein/PAS domain S-box-containing protein
LDYPSETGQSKHPPVLDILVVEDEPRYLESTRLLLTHYGHHVATAHSAGEAYEQLAARHFDLMLLDLMLPDATGHDVMDTMHHCCPDTLITVVSGDTSFDSAIGALRRGAYDFLRKPYEPEVLLKSVLHAANELALKRENRDMHHRLSQSEQWHRFLVNNSPDLIYTLDTEGVFTYVNDSMERTTGFSKDQLIGQGWQFLVPPDDVELARWHINERRTGLRSTQNQELRFRRPPEGMPGEHPGPAYVTVEVSAMGIYGGNGDGGRHFQGTYGVARDISVRKQAEATITFHAYHDLLTGLPNRVLFNDRLGQAIANARRHGLILAVMFLDLDRFKSVNDTLGHLIGDELLQMASQRLRNCLREGDTLARIGGDEFMLLLPHIHNRDNAAYIAQKMLSALKTPFHISGHEIFITASIGIAIYPDDGDSLQTLIKQADIAMYSAKDRGRNDYCFFEPGINTSISVRMVVENDLRRALQRNEFQVYYQPQVDITGTRIVGMEALLRWQHPVRGMIPPAEFIPVAEETGLIAPIGQWVLQAACAQTHAWQGMSPAAPTLAVNLSAKQLEHPRFVERFRQLLEENGLSGDRIELEITESTLMRDLEGSITKLKQLSDMGVEISIDDFGTGYSSLSYLNRLPVHSIKIDRSFVQGLDGDTSGSTIVAGIAAMAKGLHLNVVAEGVETEDQLGYLRKIGCDAYQGYLFSQAVSAEDATRLLMSHQPSAPLN